jgi:hypothetical protein
MIEEKPYNNDMILKMMEDDLRSKVISLYNIELKHRKDEKTCNLISWTSRVDILKESISDIFSDYSN